MANHILNAKRTDDNPNFPISLETAQEAINLINDYENAPKTEREEKMILAAFTRCIAICATRPDNEMHEQLYINEMVSRLNKEPLDCALSALEEYPNTNKWRPLWADLKALITTHNKPRQEMRWAIFYSTGIDRNKLDWQRK